MGQKQKTWKIRKCFSSSGWSTHATCVCVRALTRIQMLYSHHIYLFAASERNGENKRKMTVIIPVSKNVSIFAIFIFSSTCAIFPIAHPQSLGWFHSIPFIHNRTYLVRPLRCCVFTFFKSVILFTWYVHSEWNAMSTSIFACAKNLFDFCNYVFRTHQIRFAFSQ